jgi:hypothetical protein
MEPIQSRVLGITQSTATGISTDLRAVMTITGLQQEGFYIVLPVRVALQLQGNDGQGLRRLERRCPDGNVHLRVFPPAHANPPHTEQILKCDGCITINGIMQVVKEVMNVLGPKDG